MPKRCKSKGLLWAPGTKAQASKRPMCIQCPHLISTSLILFNQGQPPLDLLPWSGRLLAGRANSGSRIIEAFHARPRTCSLPLAPPLFSPVRRANLISTHPSNGGSQEEPRSALKPSYQCFTSPFLVYITSGHAYVCIPTCMWCELLVGKSCLIYSSIPAIRHMPGLQ